MPGPGIELIGTEEIAEVLEVLNSRYLSRYGPSDDPSFTAKVHHVEQEMARLAGVRYALGLSGGGSAALWIALLGLGVGSGDEVIVPGFTYVASISSIVYAGATPVLAEVDDTFDLDPADVEAKITPRTAAILVVHMLGAPARLTELKAIADKHGIPLIEDCAQAAGASYQGQGVGGIGKIGTFSFNEFKTITCGDGGLLVTDDQDLYERCFAMHDQGHAPYRLESKYAPRPFLGMNFRMTELSGAVLLAQLRKLADITGRLRANKAIVKSILGEVPEIGFRTLTDPDGDLATHLVVMLPTAEIARTSRPRSARRSWPSPAGMCTATWTTSSSGGPRPARAVPSTAPARTIRARSTGSGCCPRAMRSSAGRSASASGSRTRTWPRTG